MGKIILALLAVCGIGFSAQALPLFPFFVDVAGDFHDGQNEDFAALGIVTEHWQVPTFFTTVKEADDFLNDVLPYSTETIIRKEVKIDNNTVIVFSSPMLDEKVSEIYLYENPSKQFIIGYIEKPTN